MVPEIEKVEYRLFLDETPVLKSGTPTVQPTPDLLTLTRNGFKFAAFL
jgi:hypothetical protein